MKTSIPTLFLAACLSLATTLTATAALVPNDFGKAMRDGARILGGGRRIDIRKDVIIEWKDFSIERNRSVFFKGIPIGITHANDRSPSVLNKVVSSKKSIIDDNLTLTNIKNFYLINPNGIVIGTNGSIKGNGASIILSTLDLAEGDYRSDKQLRFKGSSQKSIEILGSISTRRPYHDTVDEYGMLYKLSDVFIFAQNVKIDGHINTESTLGVGAGNDFLVGNYRDLYRAKTLSTEDRILLSEKSNNSITRTFVRMFPDQHSPEPNTDLRVGNNTEVISARTKLMSNGNIYAHAINTGGYNYEMEGVNVHSWRDSPNELLMFAAGDIHGLIPKNTSSNTRTTRSTNKTDKTTERTKTDNETTQPIVTARRSNIEKARDRKQEFYKKASASTNNFAPTITSDTVNTTANNNTTTTPSNANNFQVNLTNNIPLPSTSQPQTPSLTAPSTSPGKNDGEERKILLGFTLNSI